ncbi:hypothetical protein A6A03_16335 [Chloroflexus islandicus]|uniref:CheW-like domain-containing protein n=1 Tax=Chloroflexus islandicus TaxID=1707952 RepID=A0A178M8P0_9CHLR|nr:hypothetical protein [Chloroflexus islandicus]OAN44587.1 hypothetical protein A6A03_16335 [Chloroflexus islandicus]
MILLIETVARRYVCRQHDVDSVGLATQAEQDERGRRIMRHHLGPLLDPADPPASGRLHALTINLRRRVVELVVPRVDLLAEAPVIVPLAPFLTARLRLPWANGVALLDDQPVIVLDLRRMAADLALGLRLAHA